MVAAERVTINHSGRRLSYRAARRIAGKVTAGAPAKLVLIDLSRATGATTAGLARLVLLRRNLLADGRDLRIRGLTRRANALYEICRMDRLLPRA